MSLNVAELHTVLHDLFHDTADELAQQTGFCRRRRLLTGPVFAQALVFALLDNPDATLEDFADFADEQLEVAVTPSAFEQRFTQTAADFLGELLGAALQRCFNLPPALQPLLRRFQGVYLRDASLVSLPDSLADLFPARSGTAGTRTAAVKLVLELEVSTGQFTELEILPAHDNEKTAALAAKPLPQGALLLEDMGFLCGARLQDYTEQGVYVLTRVPWWTACFTKNPYGKGYRRLDLLKWLRQPGGDCRERDVYVFHQHKVPLRLLAVRVPPEVARQRQEQVRRDARQRGRPVSQRKLDLCEWNLLLTNAPAELLSAYHAWEVRAVRWQIELVFKLFKSEGGLERTQARDPWRVLTEVYAKLLALVVQQWILLSAGCVLLRHSLRRASRRVRKRAARLLRGLGDVRQLARQIAALGRELRRCVIRHQLKTPSTWDRLAALDYEFREQEQAA